MPLRTFTDNQSPCFLSKYICFLLKEGRAQWNPKKNMQIFFIFFFFQIYRSWRVTMGSQFIHRFNALFVLPRNFTMKIKKENKGNII